jgi:hypothetical protein
MIRSTYWPTDSRAPGHNRRSVACGTVFRNGVTSNGGHAENNLGSPLQSDVGSFQSTRCPPIFQGSKGLHVLPSDDATLVLVRRS